ncbi:MAG: glutamate--tRNA ligase [Cyclobacteriaceae bacterium]
MNPVRVRFAPSPTGGLHIGGLRTALYNYLLARQTGGTMILRIEDTDQSRFVPGAEQYIQESLTWVGISIDESPTQGGPFGPYRQSERKDIYDNHIRLLLESGKAYYAFDTEQELEQMRDRLKASGASALQYDHSIRLQMRNSLTLPEDEVKKLVGEGKFVIRMKVEPGQSVVLNDIIRGNVQFDSGLLDDKVLMKSDGMPTYHLANVVDDHLMKITHVIRGEEWLPSAPLHVLLYKAFGWADTMPRFAHLPLLLKPDGNGKLSKRDADQLGFPIFPLNWVDPRTNELSVGYRESGYLPEALINFLVFLGWNPGTEQEIFSMNELISTFSMERIGKAGAKFDIQKARWFNQQYLKVKTNQEIAEILLTLLHPKGIACSHERAVKIAEALKERITFPQELLTASDFYFHAPEKFDLTIVSKKWNDQAGKVLIEFAESIRNLSDLNKSLAQDCFEKVCNDQGVKPGQILQLLRITVSGAGAGPDLMLSLEILGGHECAERIRKAVSVFSNS